MKELKQISGFLQKVTDAFAAVVDVDIGVIDKDLEVIAGTGYYANEVGFVYDEGCMTNRMLVSARQECVVVKDTRQNEACRNCRNFDDCKVMAYLMCPISYLNEKIGTFSLLALNEQQRDKRSRNTKRCRVFRSNLCSFITTTLNEKKMEPKYHSWSNSSSPWSTRCMKGLSPSAPTARSLTLTSPPTTSSNLKKRCAANTSAAYSRNWIRRPCSVRAGNITNKYWNINSMAWPRYCWPVTLPRCMMGAW